MDSLIKRNKQSWIVSAILTDERLLSKQFTLKVTCGSNEILDKGSNNFSKICLLA